MNRTCYNYMLIDPSTQEARYVGKAVDIEERLDEHLKPSNLEAFTHKNNWIKQVLAGGFKPEITILETHDSDEEAFAAEKFWIAYFRSIGVRLTNSTDGGEGSTGAKRSAETRKLLSDKAKLRDYSSWVPPNKQVHYIIFGVELRKCKLCKESKPLKDYTKRTPDGNSHQTYCKPCRADYQGSYRIANPPTLLTPEEHAVIRQENHKKSSETLKRTYQNRPELKAQLSKQRSKAIQGVNVITKEVITFSSALEAKSAGFQNSNIGQAIKLNKAYRGYTWSFIQETL